MLFRLELQNFYSIRDPQMVDLRVSAKVQETESRFAHLHPGSPVRVPKVVALLGPNASGKSTVLRGLAFISWFVQHSFQLPPAADQPVPGGFQPCERFFINGGEDEPTRLCVHFTAPINPFDSAEQWSVYCRYAYEVSFESKAGRPRNVISEVLRQWPSATGKSLRVFERHEDRIVGSKLFNLSGYSNVIDKVRLNSSLVSTLAQFDHKPSLIIRQIAGQIVSNILIEKFDITDAAILQWYGAVPAAVQALNKELQRIDVGIKSMQLVPTPQGLTAQFEHEGLSVPVPMNLESHGTRQFVRIFPTVVHALNTGGIAVIDELDQSIHPVVLAEVVRWFHDPQRNQHDAQLWMTCQNPAILDELQKEEVVFADKDGQGRTRIYSLQDVKSVRRNENLYKKYLGGVYGAVPNVG